MKTQTLSERLNGYTEGYTKNISEAKGLELGPLFSKLGDMIELAFNQNRDTTDFAKRQAAKPGSLKKKIMSIGDAIIKQMDKEDVFFRIDPSQLK